MLTMLRAGCGALLGALLGLALPRAAAPVQTLGEDASFSDAASAELLLVAFGAPWCQSRSLALLLCACVRARVCLCVCLTLTVGGQAPTAAHCRRTSPMQSAYWLRPTSPP